MCFCEDAGGDLSIGCLRDCKNYMRLSNEEKAQLLALCLALSPDKLVGSIFFPVDEIEGFNNAFYKLSAVSTKLVVADNIDKNIQASYKLNNTITTLLSCLCCFGSSWLLWPF